MAVVMDEPSQPDASAGQAGTAAPSPASTGPGRGVGNGVGTLAERSLHAGIKDWYRRPGDEVEVPVDGFVIDIVRGEQLIEIQTRGFGAMRRKLRALLAHHPVLVLHPVAVEKWIVRETAEGHHVGRRRSPKRCGALDLFSELMRLPDLLAHPRLSVGVLLTRQEEVRRDDGRGSWRRQGWSIHDRRLLEVVETRVFSGPGDLRGLLPSTLPESFTTRDLADAARIRLDLAQRVTYTLERCGEIELVGKDGRFNLFRAATG